MPPKDIELIIRKYLNNEISFKELSRLSDDMSKEHLLREIKRSIEIDYLISKSNLNIDDSKDVYLKLLKRAKSESSSSAYRLPRINTFYKYAAILIVFIASAYFVQQAFFSNDSNLVIEDEPIVLQLENGKTKVIDQATSAKIINTKGEVVADQQGDILSYKQDATAETLNYHTLKIPFGKKFKLELGDGTIVHLNAGTQLRFPEKFSTAGERKVFVDGEAYFEVAKDENRPFVVNAKDIDVTVLGTKFNVSTFPEENYITTVLVSGSVQLSALSQSVASRTLLSPGEKGSWNNTQGQFNIEKVETSNYTAWIDGRLVFRNMSFNKIKAKLQRHYNVTIINNNESLDDTAFMASFDIESIEEVMEIFERNFGIRYEIKNNKILIN